MLQKVVSGTFFHSTTNLSNHHDSLRWRILRKGKYMDQPRDSRLRIMLMNQQHGVVTIITDNSRKTVNKMPFQQFKLWWTYVKEDFEAIDEVCPIERITSNSNAKSLPQAYFCRLVNCLVSQCSRSADSENEWNLHICSNYFVQWLPHCKY